jgi:hypothetical protein
MHCSADLTDERKAADADGDRAWDDGEGADGPGDGNADVPWGAGDGEPDASRDPAAVGGTGGSANAPTSAVGDGEPMLDPDGLVDDSLTVVVGIGGGLVVGFVGAIALAVMTDSGWGVLLGLLAWLGATAVLVRQRTVQAAVAKSGYAVAAVLLLVPLIAFSPFASVDGGFAGRLTFFIATLFGVAVPAGIAAGIGYLAAQFVPEETDNSDETEGSTA